MSAEKVSSRERILGTLDNKAVDYTPCAFMLHHQLEKQSANQESFVQSQLAMGIDPFVSAGHLKHSTHPDVRCEVTVDGEGEETIYTRTYHTPAGPLTQRISKTHDYPDSTEFPLFHDFNVTRAKEVLVKVEEDLDRLPYLFGPARLFMDGTRADCAVLRGHSRGAA